MYSGGLLRVFPSTITSISATARGRRTGRVLRRKCIHIQNKELNSFLTAEPSSLCLPATLLRARRYGRFSKSICARRAQKRYLECLFLLRKRLPRVQKINVSASWRPKGRGDRPLSPPG